MGGLAAAAVSAFDDDQDANLGLVEEAVALAISLAQAFHIGTDTKAGYKQADATALQVTALYGPDFVSGSQALGIDANAVSLALSDYLKADGINLTPAQLMADASAKSPAAVTGSNLPVYVLGAGGVFLLLMMMRR